ncbi:hypothetical protein SAMN04487972_11268 [Paracoccus halophilus]|uniref:Uncharacterized protein n=1 Tax=Paracoccus halophilus TaxID=376733 RepID=A0A099F2P4_9RHOB|nr:hypothetical protein [Paracoccus halophilus]KGJ04503.1 hypothetical protein IT41_10320 [Paracoccus halophilus]SFA54585.1 hypothetical protein SAMN04487972_11268 [Paracoccus halophilus]
MLRKISLWLVGLVVLACYVVPYGLLADTPSWTGAFLFWTLAGVAVIVLNALATASFKDDDQ